ncbi:MBL fold metallo-hydrolase [Pyruvatibacter mobilis]|uniref:MBL fold metallo-hydrolase n=1 Tax=Pyruvatibacter mobilis TaxID=1712261 RepID=A0A845Q9C4_9HYPH|nr:MBL fold metallo-hydrolase [Pyruvatibacter mobilis]NBG95245.1 MBL fold metallo-hydrolase [Pyruvatibacter mobilis]QJD75653.1 MBL fold metallo-hydrolase [Pyruvatibacter mobilis]GGD17437.1 MBL fold metallo-hydrolase [Pyruvatibacter mobilis]
MADLPLTRDFEPDYGHMVEVSPLVRRVVAQNPSAFTFKGTGTYVIGRGKVAVIDPGPLDDAHVQAILDGLPGETITHILITHTHNDHSPAAAPLKEKTGAPTYGFGPHGSGQPAPEGAKMDEGGDMAFVPDHVIADGDVIGGDGWTVECVFTPGHTSNHMCFGLREEKALFTGDHVMGWSTAVIAPPDGDMRAYMASLRKLLERDDAVYYPTHGAPVDKPQSLVRGYITHRKAREAQILKRLEEGDRTITAMVPVMYAETDKRLYPAAARSVFAHMKQMAEEGRVLTNGTPEISGEYWLP